MLVSIDDSDRVSIFDDSFRSFNLQIANVTVASVSIATLETVAYDHFRQLGNRFLLQEVRWPNATVSTSPALANKPS